MLLWLALFLAFAAATPEASQSVRTGSYERLVDQARRDMRAWDKRNVQR